MVEAAVVGAAQEVEAEVVVGLGLVLDYQYHLLAVQTRMVFIQLQ